MTEHKIKKPILSETMAKKEAAAGEQRHWVRLTYMCNNKCVFCLDTEMQNGTAVPFDDVVRELKTGIELGRGKVILSGGEATLHPQFLDIVRTASGLGYNRIQLVTNGRMFAYGDFTQSAIEAGLHEVTFSMHGHTPEMHDAQTRASGSFQQAMRGLANALKSRKLIVNVDIVINKHNYRHIDEIMDFFIRLGIHEFDLLHVTPFGGAWENRQQVMYDPAEAMKHLNRAFAYSRRKDLFVWTNRFPPSYLAEFPDLIQNPVKLKDEVRGRAEMFDAYLRSGAPPLCRGPRCRFCFIQGLCDEMFQTKKALDAGAAPAVRTTIEQLPLLHEVMPGGARLLIIHGQKLPAPGAQLKHIPEKTAIHLMFADYKQIDKWILQKGKRKLCATARDPEIAMALLAKKGTAAIIEINNRTESFIQQNSAALRKAGALLALKNPAGIAEALSDIPDPAAFFRSAPLKKFETINVPGCLVKTEPRMTPWFLDLEILDNHRALDMQKITQVYIQHRYYIHPQGCSACAKKKKCPGLHVNNFRARGFHPNPFS